MPIQEPSSNWMADYQESTRWLVEHNYVRSSSNKELYSLFWLSKQIKVNTPDLLDVINCIRRSRDFFADELYIVRNKPKGNGKFRRLYIPDSRLKKIQKKLNRYLASDFDVHDCAFGFSQGNVKDALIPHLDASWILKVDFKNAFPSVSSLCVFDTLRYQYSWYVSRALTDLIVYDEILPQGAPTSPRIFDIVCRSFDKYMIKLVENYGGKYTRYADNVFVSVTTDKFPRSLRQGILKTIENKKTKYKYQERRDGPDFQWHKLRICKTINVAVRGLGLNIINGKLHNTRSWKEKFRKTIHHVQYLVNNSFGFEEDWLRLQGMVQFACEDTLSIKLIEQLYSLYIKINSNK